MSHWKALGELALTGVLHTTEEVTIYVTEEGPGHLVIHLLKKQGALNQLPNPNKDGAIDSKAFRQIWKRAIGDHPLLSDASPQRYRVIEHDNERFLWVEVHGLSDQPAPQKTANGVLPHEPAIALAPPPPEDDTLLLQPREENPQTLSPDDLDEDTPPALPPALPTAPPPAPEPLAAATATGPLPGEELAALPALPREDPAARLRALQDEINTLLQDPQAALTRLQQELASPPGARGLAENLYIHAHLGQLALKEGDLNRAQPALERAFALDPRDRVVLHSYGDLLRQQGQSQRALQVDRNLLLHHRRALDPAALSQLYRNLGLAHRALGDLDRARLRFEQALEARADDRDALDLLLETVEAQGDAAQLIKARQRLLEQMRDPAGRAMLRVAIGDDYRDRLRDLTAAADAYEAATDEHPAPAAFQRLADAAAALKDWRRAADALARLGAALQQGPDAADAFARAAALFQHELGAWEQAAANYERALDAHPDGLNPLEELVSMLVASRLWDLLQRAYQRMITRAQQAPTPNTELLSALWFKLGEVERLHRKQPDAAMAAYQEALSLNPDNIPLHEQLAAMLSARDDKPSREAALSHYQRALDASPDFRPELLEKIGVLRLQLGDWDAAWCELRALTALGHGNDKARAFVAEHTSQVLKPLSRKLDPAFVREHVLAPGYDPALAEAYALAADALRKLLAHDLEHYSLRGRDRIDQNHNLIFNKIYHNIGESLGFTQRPPIYQLQDLDGMRNGELYPPGFLVGGSLLSGRSEKEIAFTVAKQLWLFQDEPFLAQIRPLPHLQFIFYAMAKAYNPNINVPIPNNDNTKRVVKALMRIEGPRFKALMEDLLQRKTVNLEALQTCFEDTANRCGLLFCDDLDTCRAMLSLEPKPINPDRSLEQRMAPLIAWSVTPHYKALRQALGLKLA
jgi:tetratricopeptide (TPR) repeat protein